MVGRLGFAPSSRRLRAGTSLSKFATLVAVCKDRDTKAELNHRGEVCEALADTGISRRVKWTERRVTLPLDLAPEASASLLGHALRNGLACRKCAYYSGLEDRRVSLNTYARRNGIRAGIAPAFSAL